MLTVILHPNAAGDRQEWNYGPVGAATQWQALLTNDGDASFIGASWPVSSATSLFRFDALPVGIGTISNVQVNIICRRTHNNLGSVDIRVKNISGVESGGGIQYFSNTTYVGFSRSLGPMTVAEVNSLQAGASLTTNFWGTIATYLELAVTYTGVVAPTVATNPASPVEQNQATLNGILTDDGGAACDCGFEWGETIAYGNTTPTENRTTGQSFTYTITGLDPNKTYHFRAFATNPNGTGYGLDRSFTTPVVLPAVSTQPATDISVSRATLQGILTYDGGQDSECSFEWGLTPSCDNTTPWQNGRRSIAGFVQPVASLKANTVYYCKALARNSAGMASGTKITFRTPQEPFDAPAAFFDPALKLLLEEET